MGSRGRPLQAAGTADTGWEEGACLVCLRLSLGALPCFKMVKMKNQQRSSWRCKRIKREGTWMPGEELFSRKREQLSEMLLMCWVR